MKICCSRQATFHCFVSSRLFSSPLLLRLVFALMVLSVSCVKGQKQMPMSGYGGQEQAATISATFLPNTVELVQSTPGRVNSWDMPLVRTYTFRVRLIQRNDSAPLRNQPMLIWDEKNREGQAVSTDTNGYLQWNERISYNYLAESKYIQLTRQIKGATQINRGHAQIQLCLNPWIDRGEDSANKRSEFIDCSTAPYEARVPDGYGIVRGDHSERALSGLDTRGELSVDAPIYVKEVTVESDSSSLSRGFAEYNYVLRFRPQFITHGGNKLWLPVGLRKGRLRVTAMLREVLRKEGEPNKIVSEVIIPTHSQVLDQDFFDYEFQQRISFKPKAVCQVGELQLGLRIEPVGGPPGLKAFDGIFHLGDCSAYAFGFRNRPLTTEVREKLEALYDLNKNAVLQQTGHYGSGLRMLEDWLKKTEQSTVATASHEHKNTRRSNEQFRLERLQPRFKRVVPGETAMKRTLLFSVSTCITNGGSAGATQKFLGVPFDVYRILYDDHGNRTEVRKLNDMFKNGEPYWTQSGQPCLTWLDTLEHQYYVREHYFKHVYDVRFSGSPPPTLKEDGNEFQSQRTALINPWDWGFTFGQDLDEFGGAYAYAEQESKVDRNPRSQLILYGFRYETISFRYEIDRFMNLKVKKNVLFRIEPLVTRYHSIVSGRGANHESLRDGFYLLKTALQKYYDDHGIVKQYLDTHQKVVLVQGGVIVTPTSFSVSDLRLMRVRSNLLIELQPLDEKKLCAYSFDKKNEEWLKSVGYEGVYAAKREDACKVINFAEQMVFPEANGNPKAFEPYLLAADGPEGTGLPARTFVGPIIPLSNSFSSSTWPTDSLDESDCLEREICDKIHAAEAEWRKRKLAPPDSDDFEHLFPEHRYSQFQKFFDSESNRPLKNISVSQLMEEQVKVDQMNEQQMDFLSQFHRYAENANLEYLQVRHQEKVANRFTERTMNRVNRALPHEDLANNFLKELNKYIIQDHYYFPRYTFFVAKNESELFDEARRARIQEGPLSTKFFDPRDPGITGATMADLESLVMNGKIGKVFGERLCAYWFNEFLPKSAGMTTKEFYKSANALSNIYTQCRRSLFKENVQGEEGLSGIFAVDQRLKIQELKDYSFERGMSFNIHINGDKRITHTEDFKRSIQMNLRLPQVPSGIVPGAETFYKFMDSWIGFFSGNLGINRGQTNASASGVSSSAATNLVIQMAKFNVTINQYEPCITIGVRPEFLMGRADFFAATSNRLEASQKVNIATRGILVCTGESVNEPVKLRENYYYVSQNFVEGDMNDPGTLKTHPWLLTLRGSADFAKFMRVLVDTVDLRHAVNQIRERDEQDRAQESRRLEVTRAHHISEPRGIVFQGPSETENTAPSFDPSVPLERREVGRQALAFEQTRQDGVPRDPWQAGARMRTLAQADRWREEIKKQDAKALEGRVDIRTLGTSRETGPISTEDMAKIMGANNPNSSAWLEIIKREESKKRWSILDFDHIQVPKNPLKWYFEDPHLDTQDEIWDYSLNKLSEIYLGTASTAPGFIVITRESFQTYKEH